MANLRQYTESDVKRAYAAYITLDSVHGASKSTGIPRGTIRAWKKEWDKGNVPDVSQELEQLPVSDWVAEAKEIKNLALHQLRRAVKTASASQLATVIQTLDQQIAREEGLLLAPGEVATNLPDAEYLGTVLGKIVKGALSAAEEREQELLVVDAEVIEPAAIESHSKEA